VGELVRVEGRILNLEEGLREIHALRSQVAFEFVELLVRLGQPAACLLLSLDALQALADLRG